MSLNCVQLISQNWLRLARQKKESLVTKSLVINLKSVIENRLVQLFSVVSFSSFTVF